MQTKRTRLVVAGIVAGVLTLALPLTSSAQDDRTWLQVRSSQVKPGSMNDYVELQKTFTAALKADGRPGRTVWREVRGDVGKFHTVTFVQNLAELDEPFVPPMDDDDWEDWVADIQATQSHSTRQILRVHQEWAIPAEEGSQPGLLLLRTVKVKAGKNPAFHNWVASRLIPALKEGGAQGVTFNHVAFGDDISTWIIGARLPNWAALQQRRGNLAHLTDLQYVSIMSAMSDLIESTDLRILAYQPDLSFQN